MHAEVCQSCRIFLRIGIPVIAVAVLLVVCCIIWYDRYDKYRMEQQVQRKKNQTAKHTYNNDIESTENKSVSDGCNRNDDTPSSMEKGSNNDLEMAQEQSPSKSSITKSIPDIDFTRESLHIVSVADHEESNEWNDDATGKGPSSTSIAHHIGKLIEQIREGQLTTTTTTITISQDDEQSQNDNNNQDDNDDGQSSIESDATPVVENKQNNMIVLHDLCSISPPLKENYTTTTFREIGMIRNNLSLPGSTESESTTSISSSSSTTSSSNDKSHDSNSSSGMVHGKISDSSFYYDTLSSMAV